MQYGYAVEKQHVDTEESLSSWRDTSKLVAVLSSGVQDKGAAQTEYPIRQGDMATGSCSRTLRLGEFAQRTPVKEDYLVWKWGLCLAYKPAALDYWEEKGSAVKGLKALWFCG